MQDAFAVVHLGRQVARAQHEQRAAQRGNHARRGSGSAHVEFAEAFQRMIPQVLVEL